MIRMARNRGRGHQELLPLGILFMQDMVLVVEVVELLRQLEGVLRKISGLGGRDGLIDDPF